MPTSTTRRIPLALALVAGCLPGPYWSGATTGTTTTNGTDSAGTTSAGATDPTTTSPTSSTGSTSSTGTSGGTTLCSFLDCAPDTSAGQGVECDMWTQDCPEGQKCMPWAADGSSAWNATKCTDVMPNAGKPGDACTVEGNGVSGIDSCEKASMCWNVSQDTGEGTCVGFCMGSIEAPSCPIGTQCTPGGEVLILCLPFCNPLLQDCPSMESCIPQPMGDGFECIPDASGDKGPQNDPCTPGEACDPGLVCLLPTLASECDAMAPGCCLPFCDLSMPACTNKGATCLAWYEQGMAPSGLENVGICGIPP